MQNRFHGFEDVFVTFNPEKYEIYFRNSFTMSEFSKFIIAMKTKYYISSLGFRYLKINVISQTQHFIKILSYSDLAFIWPKFVRTHQGTM